MAYNKGLQSYDKGNRNENKSYSTGKNSLSEAIAPYNFISIPNKIISRYSDFSELPGHNKLTYNGENLLNGTIEYTIEAKSPLIISAGNDKQQASFFKDQNNKYAIPGSSIRGMIRTNSAILSRSSLVDEIQDDLFLYRTFADKSNIKEDYKNRLGIKQEVNNKTKQRYNILRRVKAGYIYKLNNKEYAIIPPKSISTEDRTYFRVGEDELRMMNSPIEGIKYMYNEKINTYKDWKEKFIITSEYKKLKELKKSNMDLEKAVRGKFLREIRSNNKNCTYIKKISFELSSKKHIRRIDKENVLKNNGYLMCSEYIDGKISHYIINEKGDINDQKIINSKFIDSYEDDLIKTKKKVSKDHTKYEEINNKYSFYYLPDNIGIENGKPIFYAEYNNRLYFGFTPYLRIFYDFSVRHGVSDSYREPVGIDYCKAIFGFADNDKSFKSRVSFEDAKLIGKEVKSEEVRVVLGEPKATCFPNYIYQPNGDNKNKLVSYNESDFTIRGIKQYWLKESINPKAAKDNVNILIKPLGKGNIFKGKIHFNNLQKDELGLILWALRLEEGCVQNIGLAKPYGYGEIELKDIKLSVEDLDKRYGGFSLDFEEEHEVSEYIDYYKNYIRENLSDGLNVDEFKEIKELLVMKSLKLTYEESRYMELSNPKVYPKNEFSHRASLPTSLDMEKRKNNKYTISKETAQAYEEASVDDLKKLAEKFNNK